MKRDEIVAVGLYGIGKETGFYIEYASGKEFRTKGKITKETEAVIRHLQAEVMLQR